MSTSRISVILRHIYRLVRAPGDAEADGALLERFADHHDEQAFAVLMRRHGPAVWGVSCRVLGHEQDVEDVFQATFLLLARQAGTIRRRAAVGSWLFGVAYRLALQARTKAARRHNHERRAARSVAVDQPADVTWRELRDVLDEELARLPDKYRAPLLLCYFEGLTQEEAANQLGWSRRSVKDRLERGRNRLRGRLARRGLTLSAALFGPLLAPGTSSAVVPVTLAETTVRAAVAFAQGESVTAAVSAQALALVDGGLLTMVPSKTLLVTAGLLVVIATGGAGVLLGHAGRESGAEAAVAAQATALGRVDRLGDPLPPGALLRLGTVRFRTGGFAVGGLGFLPDSKTIVTTTGERATVQFWEAGTGKRLREVYIGNPGFLSNFALSPDGRYFAVGGLFAVGEGRPRQGAIRIWETNSGQEVRALPRPDRGMEHCPLAFTPDGKMLMSIDTTGVLRIEEVASGTEVLRHQFPRDNSANLAISSDGSKLAVASGGNTHKLYVWKWQTAEEPRELRAPRYNGRSLAFSPDGRNLAEAGDVEEEVRVWDVASGRLVQKLDPPQAERHWFSSLAFAPDGTTLIATSHSNTTMSVHLWDGATWQYRRRLDPGAGMLRVSPDSQLLAGSFGSGVRLWDLASGKELAVADEAHQSNVTHIAATGNQVVTTGDDHTIRVWDAATGAQRLKLTHGNWVRAIALSPDGSKLASSSGDDTVRLWDVATGRAIYTLPGHGRLGGQRALGFTPDGLSFLSWGDDMCLRKWDVRTGKAVLEHVLGTTRMVLPDGREVGGPRRDLGTSVFLPDGSAFVLNTDEHFQVFDVTTGKELRRFPKSGSITAVAVSPDSRMMLTSAYGNSIRIPLPDGSFQVASAKDHPVILWELASGKERRQLTIPGREAGAVAFSADGKVFATASGEPDPRIQVWDVATGEAVGTLQGVRGGIRSLAFSPDGRRLTSGMDDTTALVWDVPSRR